MSHWISRQLRWAIPLTLACHLATPVAAEQFPCIGEITQAAGSPILKKANRGSASLGGLLAGTKINISQCNIEGEKIGNKIARYCKIKFSNLIGHIPHEHLKILRSPRSECKFETAAVLPKPKVLCGRGVITRSEGSDMLKKPQRASGSFGKLKPGPSFDIVTCKIPGEPQGNAPSHFCQIRFGTKLGYIPHAHLAYVAGTTVEGRPECEIGAPPKPLAPGFVDAIVREEIAARVRKAMTPDLIRGVVKQVIEKDVPKEALEGLIREELAKHLIEQKAGM